MTNLTNAAYLRNTKDDVYKSQTRQTFKEKGVRLVSYLQFRESLSALILRRQQDVEEVKVARLGQDLRTLGGLQQTKGFSQKARVESQNEFSSITLYYKGVLQSKF